MTLDPVGDFQNVVFLVLFAGGEEVFKHPGEDLQTIAAVAHIVHNLSLLAWVDHEETFE